jgi:hypothetical protein
MPRKKAPDIIGLLIEERDDLSRAIEILKSRTGSSGKSASSSTGVGSGNYIRKKKRKMSEETRAKISQGMKKKHAKKRAAKKAKESVPAEAAKKAPPKSTEKKGKKTKKPTKPAKKAAA